MKFSRPAPFLEAITVSRRRVALPTSLDSAQLAEIDAGILAQARFSAKVRSVKHLSILDDGVDTILQGKSDFATQRLKLKQFLRSTGYRPPEGEDGGLQDFSSVRRTDLQLKMNVQADQAIGWEIQGNDPALLDAFPAREFVRVESREEERTDWPQRWNAARAATIADGATDSSTGVMAALVGHPIWKELSRFKRETEPYDYGSGMGREDVSRARAMELGLIGRDTKIPPAANPLSQPQELSLDVRSANLRSLLEATGVGRYNAQGVFIYNGKGGRG